MEKLTQDQIKRIERKVYQENFKKEENIYYFKMLADLIGYILGLATLLFFHIIAIYYILSVGAKTNTFTNALIICIFGTAIIIFFIYPTIKFMYDLSNGKQRNF